MEEKDKEEICSTEIAIQRKTLITRSQNSLSNMKKCCDVPITLYTELLQSKRAKLIIS